MGMPSRRVPVAHGSVIRNIYAVAYMKKHPTATTHDFDTAWKDGANTFQKVRTLLPCTSLTHSILFSATRLCKSSSRVSL